MGVFGEGSWEPFFAEKRVPRGLLPKGYTVLVLGMIAENIAAIRFRIAEAACRAGRDPSEIRIVAAAKGQGLQRIQEALAAGIRFIGHNYLQEAEREAPPNPDPAVKFHMIGHLQKNKAGKAVELFSMIETVDDEKLAGALDRRA